MDKEKIDRVFEIIEYFETDDYEETEQEQEIITKYMELLKLLGIDKNYTIKSLKDIENIGDNFLYIMMKQIEKGDYGYFKTKIGSIDSEIALSLLSYSYDFNLKKSYLEQHHNKENPIILSEILIDINDLMESEKDSVDLNNIISEQQDFIKWCIENAQKIGLNISNHNFIQNLIDSQDSIIKFCIQNQKELKLDIINIFSKQQELLRWYIKEQYTLEDDDYFISIENSFTHHFDSFILCIENARDIELNSENLGILIQSFSELHDEMKKKGIYTFREDEVNKIAVLYDKIKDIKSDENNLFINELCKVCINEFYLNNNQKINIIRNNVTDREYVKELIKSGNHNDLVNDLITLLNEQGNISKEEALEMLNNCHNLNGKSKITLLKISDNEIARQINFEELEELSLIKDYESIEETLLDGITQKITNAGEIDIADVNEKIHRMHEIFLTNNLPFNFKCFEFFKYHENYNSQNIKLFNEDIEKRDKTILIDLFKIFMDSNNFEMRNFLEILQAGDSILSDNRSLKEMTDEQKGILFKYRDIVTDLVPIIIQDGTIEKTKDYIKDLTNFRELLHLGTQGSIGNELLSRFFKDGEFEYTSIEDLLIYMNEKRNNVNNQEEFHLEVGDLIKGTEIKYLESVLRNGIRSKEFLFEGDQKSDCTPLDTDFSEIDEENLRTWKFKKNNLFNLF